MCLCNKCHSHTKEIPQNFIDGCYSKNAYIRAYEPIIHLLNGENLLKDLKKGPVLPPHKVKLFGRPKKVRRRELDIPLASTSGKRQNKSTSVENAKS